MPLSDQASIKVDFRPHEALLQTISPLTKHLRQQRLNLGRLKEMKDQVRVRSNRINLKLKKRSAPNQRIKNSL